MFQNWHEFAQTLTAEPIVTIPQEYVCKAALLQIRGLFQESEGFFRSSGRLCDLRSRSLLITSAANSLRSSGFAECHADSMKFLQQILKSVAGNTISVTNCHICCGI